MRVTALRVYPVKSLAGVRVESAVVEPWGLAGDRRFGVVDATGEALTARVAHDMLGLRAEPVDGGVRLVDGDGSSLLVTPPVDGEKTPVSHRGQGFASVAGDEAHAWLSKRLARPVRLVWQEDPTVRAIAENKGGRPGEHLSLADAGPLLLASEASMAQLNDWIAADAPLPDPPNLDPDDLSGDSLPTPGALDILRFRPNVVIDGDEPFAEDSWLGVRIGDVEFRTTMRCDRCVMTTIDPVTLAGGKEPVRTLARHHRWDGKTWFGIRLVPLAPGVVHEGDAVSVR